MDPASSCLHAFKPTLSKVKSIRKYQGFFNRKAHKAWFSIKNDDNEKKNNMYVMQEENNDKNNYLENELNNHSYVKYKKLK